MRDIYPARVVTKAKTYQKARLIFEGGVARVYVADRSEVKLAEEVAEADVRFEKLCTCKASGPLRAASIETLRAMTLESA